MHNENEKKKDWNGKGNAKSEKLIPLAKELTKRY